MPLSRYASVLCQLTSQPRDELRGRTNLLIDGRAIIPTVPSAHWTRQNTGHVLLPALETLLRVFTGKKYLHSVEGLGNALRLRHLKRGTEFTVEAGPGVVTQPLPSYGGTLTAEKSRESGRCHAVRASLWGRYVEPPYANINLSGMEYMYISPDDSSTRQNATCIGNVESKIW